MRKLGRAKQSRRVKKAYKSPKEIYDCKMPIIKTREKERMGLWPVLRLDLNFPVKEELGDGF